jgi:hypothetical protein
MAISLRSWKNVLPAPCDARQELTTDPAQTQRWAVCESLTAVVSLQHRLNELQTGARIVMA